MALYVILLAVVGLIGLYVAQSSLAGFDTALHHYVREISILSDVSEQVSHVHSTALLHVVADAILKTPRPDDVPWPGGMKNPSEVLPAPKSLNIIRSVAALGDVVCVKVTFATAENVANAACS